MTPHGIGGSLGIASSDGGEDLEVLLRRFLLDMSPGTNRHSNGLHEFREAFDFMRQRLIAAGLGDRGVDSPVECPVLIVLVGIMQLASLF